MKRRLIIFTVYLMIITGLAIGGRQLIIKQVNAVTVNSPSSTGSTTSPTSPDAIAIRVFANSQNLSPHDWYKKNIGAQRSLQSLLVDGYDAVRDDRTVYIAASDFDSNTSTESATLQLIMVVISFNQNISSETVDIFGQILNNWRFNQNINNETGNCSNNNELNCLSNKDCPSDQICNSLKSKIIRDTKRLIDLTIIKSKLEQYRQTYQHYPNLEAGTYLTNKTLSVWPSWQKTLATKLNFSLPLDPINKLGACSGFNATTCWNEQQRSFATAWPILPLGSRVYQYEFTNNTSYKLCANFEVSYHNITTSNCTPNSYVNNGPMITCQTMNGAAGQPFTGYADISDNEGDIINPIINSNQLTGWNPLTVELINNRQRIKITSPQAGDDGNYQINLTARDNLGASTTQNCTVIIGNGLCGNGTINNGEDCEGTNGIATNSNTSSSTQQYACNQYCRFTGGWCGDNVIQNGQNFTLDREQCDGSVGIASNTNDSNINRQYNCTPITLDVPGSNRGSTIIKTTIEPIPTTIGVKVLSACHFTGGYCGDQIIQTSTTQAINEQCDRLPSSTIPSPAQTYGTTTRYQCGQPGTASACHFTGGYCGDGLIDSIYGETCEAINYIQPTPANSSSTKQYTCAITTCTTTGGYCGNNSTNTSYGENCDCNNNHKNCAWAGNASSTNPNPNATSSAANLYRCQNCLQTGGWCGDGLVQSQFETCDPLEPLTTFRARIGNNRIDQDYYNLFTAACATNNCQIACYDNDSDNYGLNRYTNCSVNTSSDCKDRPNGADGLIDSPDDGANINPGQLDNCTQYDGLDNNCDGSIDNKGVLVGNPIWSDNFDSRDVLEPAIAVNQDYATTTLDATTGYNDSQSAKLQQNPPSSNTQLWPNTCTNLNYLNNPDCDDYANKLLTGLTWDISDTNLNINQNYVINFKYKGSANFLHPTTTTNSINPANQIAWRLGYSSITSTNNLILPGSYTSFNTASYLGHFAYYQDLSQLTGLYFSIFIGQNNNSNSLNIDNVSITSCQNIRSDGTYCGDGQVEGSHETCDFNMPTPNWNNTTEFCDDTCQKGDRLRILQVYPGNNNNINIQNIISNNQNNIITRTATVTAVSLTDFNLTPTNYIPTNTPKSLYNVIIFGFQDCNNQQDLSNTSKSAVENFINNNGGVIFGHDTIWARTIGCGGIIHNNFNDLAHYAGIALGTSTNNNNFTAVTKNGLLSTTSQMFNSPYLLATNFSVNQTHTSGSLPSSTLCTASDGLNIWFHGGDLNTKFWATTCGRVEHIMLGHSTNFPAISEQRSLINMFYYVATH